MPHKNTQITLFNRHFMFNWNDYRTFKVSEDQLNVIETFFSETVLTAENLPPEIAYDLGWLCYKMGTLYNHIKRDPQSALPKLQIAESILTGDALAWTQNHLALTYLQRLVQANAVGNFTEVILMTDKAMHYYQLVSSHYQQAQETLPLKIYAFAKCVEALTAYEINFQRCALDHYREALNVYEKIGALDNQYARAKQRWAMMLCKNNPRAAAKAYSELNDYWAARLDKHNPFKARFLVSYGDFLANRDKTKTLAIDKYSEAFTIICTTEGADTEFSKDILQKVRKLREESPRDSFSLVRLFYHPTTAEKGIEMQPLPKITFGS